MSYDISLYHRGFLWRALETRLGDWTNAEPIADDAKEVLVSLALAAAVAPVTTNESLAAILGTQGVKPAREFAIKHADGFGTTGDSFRPHRFHDRVFPESNDFHRPLRPHRPPSCHRIRPRVLRPPGRECGMWVSGGHEVNAPLS